jgi:hypothetical protein
LWHDRGGKIIWKIRIDGSQLPYAHGHP